MRLAVINQYSSAGGGARFVRALVSALGTTTQDLDITLFADWTAVDRDGIDQLFRSIPCVRVQAMRNGVTPGGVTHQPRLWRIRQVAKRFKPLTRVYYHLRSRKEESESAWFDFAIEPATLEELETFDVIHMAWPYFVEPFETSTPTVITMHDFNYKYPFANFSRRMLDVLERQVPQWLAQSAAIVVSSRFMADELTRFYPGHEQKTSVVRLAQFAITRNQPPADAEATLRRLGLPARYVVCPSNTSSHKNLITLLAAFGLLKRRGMAIPLVLAGYGTDNVGAYAQLNVPSNHPLYGFQVLSQAAEQAQLTRGTDYVGLGYVSDAEIDALIAHADLLVAPSRYEAGSGPAVDAWSLGTPVAFSDIPPFREQIEFWGTTTWVFDPDDAHSMADALETALRDPEARRIAGIGSREAMRRYTWQDIAAAYRGVYAGAAAGRHTSPR